jgi:hypothetical protein
MCTWGDRDENRESWYAVRFPLGWSVSIEKLMDPQPSRTCLHLRIPRFSAVCSAAFSRILSWSTSIHIRKEALIGLSEELSSEVRYNCRVSCGLVQDIGRLCTSRMRRRWYMTLYSSIDVSYTIHVASRFIHKLKNAVFWDVAPCGSG